MATKLSDEQRTQFQRVFSLFDTNKDGHITKNELREALVSLHFKPSEEDLERMMTKVDKNSNGEIDFDEFCVMMADPLEPISHEEEMVEAFRVFDTDGDGYITKEELRQVMMQLDDTMTEADIVDMINEADTNKDGRIDFKEFAAMMADKPDK